MSRTVGGKDDQFLMTDYLGTTLGALDGSGHHNSVTEGSGIGRTNFVRTSFGDGAAAPSGGERFTGKPYDGDLGAHVFPYRNYRADLGRWMSADPINFPDGPNQHHYAPVPTMGVDIWGLAGYLTVHSSASGQGSSSGSGPNLSGHSWIEYTPDNGDSTTYGTWGNDPNGMGNGLHEDLETGFVSDASRMTYLDDEAEQSLMDTISEYDNMGEDAWSYLDPCSSFASEAWEAATGEDLDDRGWIFSTPENLMNSIIEANGGMNRGEL